MRLKILIGFSLIIFFQSAYGQELTLPELSGYKKSTNYPVFVPDNLWDFINGAADNYLSYGFVNLHVAEYKKGKDVIKLEVYRQADNINAFGIYSSERSPSFRFINLGAQGYKTGGVINFFKGNYYVKIRTHSTKEKTLQSAESLALKVADMLEGGSEMPSVLSKLPEDGKKKNEETYINESVLGHKFLNKAIRATYALGSDEFSIYVLECGSQKETWNMVEAYLSATGMDEMESASGKYVLTDGYNGTVFLAWNEGTIVVISGLSKDQTDVADRYSSDILN
jgi:hypothetical protein